MPVPQPSGRPVRIDAWVWAVRMFKTRSAAATAVRAGHVKINGEAVKPSQQVVPGDRVRVWRNHHEHDLEVLATVAKRVGAPVARTCYTDHAPRRRPRSFCRRFPCARAAPVGRRRRSAAIWRNSAAVSGKLPKILRG